MRPIFVALTALATALLIACGGESVPIETSLPNLNNDLAGGKLVRVHELPGESFKLITGYRTDYDTIRWRITDSKNIYFSARIEEVGGREGVEVLVEHVHADVSIKARKTSVDGLQQDSMDDSFHGGNQPGFWVTGNYQYEEIFAIEGYSETLLSGWGFMAGGYGSSDLDEERLTENNLRGNGGAYASKVQVVYNLLIRYSGETNYHTRAVIDEFLIPLGN